MRTRCAPFPPPRRPHVSRLEGDAAALARSLASTSASFARSVGARKVRKISLDERSTVVRICRVEASLIA